MSLIVLIAFCFLAGAGVVGFVYAGSRSEEPFSDRSPTDERHDRDGRRTSPLAVAFTVAVCLLIVLALWLRFYPPFGV